MTDIAGSPWSVIIFIVVAMALTRLLDTGLNLPAWILPHISMAVGLAGQVSVGLIAGLDWKHSLVYGFAAGAGGSWSYSAGAKHLPKMRSSSKWPPRDWRRWNDRGSIKVSLLCFAAAAVVLVVLCSSCRFTVPDWCAKGQVVLRDEVSPRVEPALKQECIDRARDCVAQSIPVEQCTPTHRCKDWVRRYVAATKALHGGLTTLNELWQDLEHEGVVTE